MLRLSIELHVEQQLTGCNLSTAGQQVGAGVDGFPKVGSMALRAGGGARRGRAACAVQEEPQQSTAPLAHFFLCAAAPFIQVKAKRSVVKNGTTLADCA